MVHLGDGIEFDAKLPRHEGRHRRFEFGDAVVGIAPVLRPVDLPPHHRPHARRGHFVVFADPKIEQPPLGMVSHRLALGPFDQFELVDRRALAIVGTANSGGKPVLKPGIGGNGRGGAGGGVGGHEKRLRFSR